MEVAIIGGGSLGMMWSARMLQGGIVPTLIVRTDEQKEFLQQQGLIYSENDELNIFHPKVESLTSYQGELPFLTILTVKQTHISSLLPFLRGHINKKGYIFLLQNGLGHYEKLIEVMAPHQIILGSTSDGALRHKPNYVERTGYGEIWFGLHGEAAPPETIKAEVDRMQQLGLHIIWDEHIMRRLWRKCMINCAINPLTALLNVENGQLLHSDKTLRLMRDIYEEAIEVAKVNGFQFYEDLWQEIAAVCRNTSRNRSSMLQDLLGNRKTEIEYINGYIVTAGERVGVSTPYNQMMLRLIHAKEQLQQLRTIDNQVI